MLATCIQVVFKYYDMHVHAFKKNAEIINHKVDTLNDKNISSKKCPENHIPYSRHAVTFFENHYLFFYAYII